MLRQKQVQAGEGYVDVIPFDGDIVYLGRLVSFADFRGVELTHRFSRGWAALGEFKKGVDQ
eukprot:8268714-Pyramimonas_sp.AAC.1